VQDEKQIARASAIIAVAARRPLRSLSASPTFWGMPEPTRQDIDNAATRAAIAERQNSEYAAAVRLALGALGPGWTPRVKLALIDADHRSTGNTEPVATAYTVVTMLPKWAP
jgi:hypothetical protein